MTALEEIKKAFPNMFRPLKWHHFDGPTEHGCGEWYAHATRGMYHIYDVREKFPNDRPFYAKELSEQFDTLEKAKEAVQNRHELDIVMCLDPDFRSTLESLQRENEEARQTDPALMGIAEEMTESGGHWQPCTGCYDTLEGHPTQKYDYSPALQSPVGCGCHECGGLGAIWWYMSEQNIADFEKISEELDAEHDLTMRISRLEYLLRSLCKAYAACNGEDHPAYVEARTALASTGGEHHAE